MITEEHLDSIRHYPGVTRGKMNQAGVQKLSYTNLRQIVVLADGLDHLLDFVAKEMPTPREEGSSANPGYGSFNTFDSYEEAMDTFRNHPESLIRFDPTEMRVRDTNESGNMVEFDVTGDYIDIGRFLEDVPETWGSMHSGTARNRRATILLSLGYAALFTEETIRHRSERVLRLIDALEASGVRTELIGIESSNCSHTEVIIKHHDEPLTIADVAVISHPEFLRRVQFRIIEYSDAFKSGYGNAGVFGDAIRWNPKLLEPRLNDEIQILINANLNTSASDEYMDKLERLLVWELNKPVPEVDAINVHPSGIDFRANGQRSSEDIRREGREVMDNVD